MLSVDMQARTITKKQTSPQQRNILACVVGRVGVNGGFQRRLCLVGARYQTRTATHRWSDGLDCADQDCCQGEDATRTSHTRSMSRRSVKDGHALSLINAKPYGERGDARGVRECSAKFTYNVCRQVCVDGDASTQAQRSWAGVGLGVVGQRHWRVPDKEER